MDIEPPSLFLAIVLERGHIFSVLILLILLACSALISGAEIAFFSLTTKDFEEEFSEKESPGNLIIVKNLLSKPKKLLATILVANNFINIAIILLFASLSDVMFSGVSINYFGFNLRFILEVGIITFVILLFGEILPKVYASRNNIQFSLFMALPLNFLDILLTPISSPMRSGILFIEKKFGTQKSNISVNQLSQALALTSEKDKLHEDHKILQGIVTFGNTDTKQVMKPRMDIFALDETASYNSIIPVIITKGYSRIPVFKDNIDTITGILYVKDLMPFIDRKELNWNALLRKPYFVPENKKLDDLLNEFKEMHMHMAIVVDEYGGTSGLISLEDIIEEIVGEISDEFDDEDLVFSKLDENTFVFEGKTPLKDFYKVIKLQDPSLFEIIKGEAETLAGFLLEVSKSFPKRGEVIKFHQYTFTVEGFENKRINQIKISIKN
ncbi:MAG: gliding motility-associated protein GldE [Flavobacteriaceae bacterium]|nr:gliding motility-associated protein GldE [Flavobacteriaceae bacterium]